MMTAEIQKEKEGGEQCCTSNQTKMIRPTQTHSNLLTWLQSLEDRGTRREKTHAMKSLRLTFFFCWRETKTTPLFHSHTPRAKRKQGENEWSSVSLSDVVQQAFLEPLRLSITRWTPKNMECCKRGDKNRAPS